MPSSKHQVTRNPHQPSNIGMGGQDQPLFVEVTGGKHNIEKSNKSLNEDMDNKFYTAKKRHLAK